MTERANVLAERLADVERRVHAACEAAARPRDDVTLVVVTKFFPASDVAALAAAGVRHVGESRDQEAARKVAELPGVLAAGVAPPVVHFVGQVQTNKAGSIARYADVVHSVDRARLVTALERAADHAGRRLGVFVQVDLSGEAGRGGAIAADVPAVADRVAEADHLDLCGLMAVAPRGADPAAAFDRLAALANDVRRDHPEARWLSAGMSGDLEQAVAAGATHLRVGRAILGSRPEHD